MIGLYIHIPFCLRKCAYCDFSSAVGSPTEIEAYTHTLCASMAIMAPLTRGQSFDTLFIGGGTPSLLEPEQLRQIIENVNRYFPVKPGAECTMEANPGTLSPEKLENALRLGINRLSVGLQAAQPRLLCTLGRIHSRVEYVTSMEQAKRAGFINLNTDVMAGLPGQTPADLTETLALASDYSTHISLYGLQLEKNTPLEKRVAAGELTLPTEDEAMDMLAAGETVLAKAGFHRYEVSNYAREGYACRHNLLYWEYGEWLGLGASAASHLGNCRFTLPAERNAYMHWVERGCSPKEIEKEVLSEREAAFEQLMLGLRLTKGLNTAAFAQRWGYTPRDAAPKALQRMEAYGFLTERERFLRLSPRGFEVMNSILEEIMEEFLPGGEH